MRLFFVKEKTTCSVRSWGTHTLPAGAFAQASVRASSGQEAGHQGASDRGPSLGEASCQEGAYKAAGLACASYEEPGSWAAFPKE